MNPLTNIRNTQKLSLQELKTVTTSSASWHYYYNDSAYIFIGGLHYDLSEGDIISVFSQYGEVVSINLPKNKQTGKPKGYCYLCYEDQRSTILAVDNLNGIKLTNRIIRVDHVKDYKLPNVKSLEDLSKYDCAPKSFNNDSKGDACSDSEESYDSNEWIAAPKERTKKSKKKKKEKKYKIDKKLNNMTEIDYNNFKNGKNNKLKRKKHEEDDKRSSRKQIHDSSKRKKIE